MEKMEVIRNKKSMIESIIRVNHAGEYGAKRIYEGQLAVLKNSSSAPIIEHMKSQELEHLAYFDEEIKKREFRPTVMFPIWHIGGFAMGAISAIFGEKSAMACTVAVEEVIDNHYARQLEYLDNDEQNLQQNILKFQAEELEHRDAGLEYGAKNSPIYGILYNVITLATKFGIAVSKRI